MNEPEIGDFVISEDSIYEIWHITPGPPTTTYCVKRLNNPADLLDNPENLTMEDVIEHNGLTLSRLRHLGYIVKKEEASKAIEILFKKS